jgi:hypothetical protein
LRSRREHSFPFGGTTLFERQRREGCILTAMPFGLWYSPYVATTFAHHDPSEYYGKLIELFAQFRSPATLSRRARPRPAGSFAWSTRRVSM